MTLLTNSFSIQVPDIEATVYSIDPQPRGSEPWGALASYEYALRDEVGGSVQRYARNGDWYLLAIGEDGPIEETHTDKGTTLTSIAKHSPEYSQPHDQKPVVQALRDGLENHLTWDRDYWRFGNTSRYYEPQHNRVIDGFRAFDGFDARVAYNDGFYLTVNPKTKFASDTNLYEWIQDIGKNEVEDRFADDMYFFETKDRPTVRFVSISRSNTISDPTIPADDGGTISVIEYAKRNGFPDHIIENFDPDEPVINVEYSWSDNPVSAAPSMLRATPDKQTGNMTDYAAKDADERWRLTTDLVETIDELEMGNVTATVSHEPRAENVGQFSYPRLSFGGDGRHVLSNGEQFASNNSRTVTPDSWARAKTDYLQEHGPRKKPRGSPSIALFHQDDLGEDAKAAYDDVRDYIDRYLDITLSPDPGIQAYDDLPTLRRWVDKFGDDTTGALAYLGEYSDDYYDIIKAFNGKPLQQLTHQTYRSARNAGSFSDELYNVALALGVKIGARPYLLTESLSADAVIGLSVTGDEQNTATAVLLTGESGNLVWQTTERRGTGSKTVAPERIAEEIIREALAAAAESPEIESLDSVIVHRKGMSGIDEEIAVESMVAAFEDDGAVPDALDWCIVTVLDSGHYRIFDDSRGSHVCDTGSYARLDGEAIVVSTWAQPLIHQGTPSNLLCKVEASDGSFDIEAIGRDVFNLSFQNWGAPQMKIKQPISTYLPGKMHDVMERCPQLQYPPF